MRKFLSWCVIITLFLSLDFSTIATEDEPSGWAKELVTEAIGKGYVPEHLRSNYQKSITREEFAELFVTAVFSEVNRQEIANAGEGTKYRWHFKELTIDNFLSKVSTTENFSDTDSKYVKVANMLGMVNGVGNNKFNPDGLITREQACVMFVNYLQTVANPGGGNAFKELDDIHTSSHWAKDAVAWAYGAEFLSGTKKFLGESVIGQEDIKIIQMGHFDTKGLLTREQAIVVISRLGNPNKNRLQNLILRGLVKINMDILMQGIEIEGDSIKFMSSGYDAKYSYVKEYFRARKKFNDYHDKYTTEELNSSVLTPFGASYDTDILHPMNRALSKKETLYDFGPFTIEHNKNGYLLIITKRPNYGYLEYAAGTLVVNNNGDYSIVTGKEIK